MAFDPDAYLAKKAKPDAFDPDAYLAKKAAPAQTQAADRPAVTGGRGMAAQQMEQAAFDEDQRIEGLRQQSAQQGLPFVRDLPEIGAAPELNAMDMPAIKASMGASFTFADPEVGKILEDQLGAKIGQDAEGNYFAQMPSGQAYAINRPGLSGQDVAKLGTAVAAFTPAGRAGSVARQAIGGMATQGAIEAGQAAIGGDVNVGDIAMAGAAPVVLSKVAQAGKKLVDSVRPKAASQYLDEIANTAKPQEQMPAKQLAAQEAKQPIFELTNRQQARQGLKNGTVEGVGWKVNARGQLEADKLERDLVRAGVSDKAIVTVNRMSSEDKSSGHKMIDLARDYIRGVKGSENRPPNSVIGESMMKRFRDVSAYQKTASKDIGASVRKSAAAKVGAEDLADSFMDDLEGLKVKFEGDKMDFKLSNLANSNTKPIRTIYERLASSDGSFRDLHEIKQLIREQVSYATDPTSASKLSDRGEAVLKGLASRINDKLRSASADYAEANDRFKQAAEVVYPFAKTMGRRFDPESDLVDNLVGQELRKVLTNYAVAPDMITAYTNLDEVARGLGGKYGDDIGNLIVLNSELERIGSFKAGSLQGVGEKVSDRALERAGVAGAIAKPVLNAAKDRVMYESPSIENLKKLEQFRELLTR